MPCKLFWGMVRLTYPWLSLAILLCRIVTATDRHRIRAQVRFWRLYSQINFANVLAIAIDLIQPEYWA